MIGFGYHKTDSGMFIIMTILGNEIKLYPFPINNEYLECMSAEGLYLHYAPKVIKELAN